MVHFSELSELQMKAFDIAMRPEKQIIRIVGYAGTGKTTLLSCVAKEYSNKCVVLAPTNKACIVLKEKGIAAKTIHSYLYAPQEVETFKTDKDNNIIYHKDDKGEDIVDASGNKSPILLKKETQFILRADGAVLPKIVLVDEASMVGEIMFNDLLSIFETVIMFGDGFQLPPVKDKDILNSDAPDIFLDQVHRVAFDNPIIRFATDIRNGIDPDIKKYMDECQNREICHANWENNQLFKAINDFNVQCICGTNRTRHELNEKIRRQKGYAPNTIVKGEQVVCLENWRESRRDDDYGSVKELIFYNGQILELDKEQTQTDDHFKAVITTIKDNPQKFIMPFWNKGYFEIADDSNAWWNEWNRRKAANLGPVRGIKMDYSYAITAHKSQGSEYDNVAVFDERGAMKFMSKRDKQRWYYTGITRAKKRLLIVDRKSLSV